MRTELRRRRARHGQGGFSASELLVVVAIIGMMVLVTTPQMMNFWNSMKVRTAAHRLMSTIRLCRQAAVSKRTDVIMQLQRTEGATRPTYKAWEERSNPPNLVRNPNGADNTVATMDDERWVSQPDTTMGVEKVTFVDSYNDVTPNDALDAPGASIMSTSGNMYLRFMPNGQVVRVAEDGTNQLTDTLIRMRLRRSITSSRVDQWDITLNRVGKVGSDFNKVPP